MVSSRQASSARSAGWSVANTTMHMVRLVPFLFSSRRGLAKKGGYLLGNATPPPFASMDVTVLGSSSSAMEGVGGWVN